MSDIILYCCMSYYIFFLFNMFLVTAESSPETEPESEPETEVEPEAEAESEPEAEAESEPEPEAESEAEPEAEPAVAGGTSWTPRGDFHAMDCTDIVIGSARGNTARVYDYYTRDRQRWKRIFCDILMTYYRTYTLTQLH